MAKPAVELARGTQVWVRVDHLEWVTGSVLEKGNKQYEVALEDGRRISAKADCLEPANTDNVSACTDITELTHLNEPSILSFLLDRLAEDEIYTSAGPVLVALNPCKRLPDLFTEDVRKRYQEGKENAPHMYSVVAAAYRSMEREGAHQALVVSGESGAGKTESTKMALDYFASLSGGTTISSAILQSNPILEAFGNAKTSRNHNSSRFGKLMQIHFSPSGNAADGNARVITAATIKTYLLEKSRVVAPAEGERNYHIFHMMLRGASDAQRQRLHLPPSSTAQPAQEFEYLRKGIEDVAGRDDAAEWDEMCAAMEGIGLTAEQMEAVFSLLAGILWLGNIAFTEGENDSCTVAPDAEPALRTAASLLHLTESALREGITTKLLKVGGDTLVKPLRLKDAEVARDSLAKAIYSALFDWLVAHINSHLSPRRSRSNADTTISVLDIFGFEHFQVNSFEQLCINYANERLQQLFCRHLFQHEQQEYQREGLAWALHEYSDNAHIVGVLDGGPKPLGVFRLLEDQCRRNGTDKALLGSVKEQHPNAGGPLKVPSHPPLTFTVQHFAGSVAYLVTSMVDKNMDDLSEGLKLLMSSSSSPLLIELGKSLQGPPPRPGAKKLGVAGKFMEQMKDLVCTLEMAQLHFVRCIKPNPLLRPDDPKPSLVLEQIRCAGVVEVGRIFKAGFPTRYPIALFLKRFNVILQGIDSLIPPPPPPPPSPSPPGSRHPASSRTPPPPPPNAPPHSSRPAPSPEPSPSGAGGESSSAASPSGGHEAGGGDPRAQAERMLQQRFQLVPGEHYALGKTKIFFRAGVLAAVEKEMQRLAQLSVEVRSCASYWRVFARQGLLRRRFMEMAKRHKEWLAEQDRLKALERDRDAMRKQREAAELEAAEQKRRMEEERAEAEAARKRVEDEQRREKEEEAERVLEQARIKSKWKGIAVGAAKQAAVQAEATKQMWENIAEKAKMTEDKERAQQKYLEMEQAAKEAEEKLKQLELQKEMALKAREEERMERERVAQELQKEREAAARKLELERLHNEAMAKERDVARLQQEVIAKELDVVKAQKDNELEALRSEQLLKDEVLAALQAELEMKEEERQEMLMSQQRLREAELELAAMKEGAAKQREEEARLLNARLESFRRKEAEMEELLKRGQEALARQMQAETDGADQMVAGLTSGKSRKETAAEMKKTQETLLHDTEQELTNQNNADRINSALNDAFKMARCNSSVPQRITPSPPTPPPHEPLGQIVSINMADVPLPTLDSPKPHFGEDDADVKYPQFVAILQQLSSGAVYSQAGQLRAVIMECVSDIHTLVEDMEWVKEVKMGKAPAPPDLDIRDVVHKIGDSFDIFCRNTRADIWDLMDIHKGDQELLQQVKGFQVLFEKWSKDFQASYHTVKSSWAWHQKGSTKDPSKSKTKRFFSMFSSSSRQ